MFAVNLPFLNISVSNFHIILVVKTHFKQNDFRSRSHLLEFFPFLTRFSTKILVIRLANGVRAGGRAVGRACGRILNGVKLWFPLNNFSLL